MGGPRQVEVVLQSHLLTELVGDPVGALFVHVPAAQGVPNISTVHDHREKRPTPPLGRAPAFGHLLSLFEVLQEVEVPGHVRVQDAGDNEAPQGGEFLARQPGQEIAVLPGEQAEKCRAVMVLEDGDVIVPQGQVMLQEAQEAVRHAGVVRIVAQRSHNRGQEFQPAEVPPDLWSPVENRPGRGSHTEPVPLVVIGDGVRVLKEHGQESGEPCGVDFEGLVQAPLTQHAPGELHHAGVTEPPEVQPPVHEIPHILAMAGVGHPGQPCFDRGQPPLVQKGPGIVDARGAPRLTLALMPPPPSLGQP